MQSFIRLYVAYVSNTGRAPLERLGFLRFSHEFSFSAFPIAAPLARQPSSGHLVACLIFPDTGRWLDLSLFVSQLAWIVRREHTDVQWSTFLTHFACLLRLVSSPCVKAPLLRLIASKCHALTHFHVVVQRLDWSWRLLVVWAVLRVLNVITSFQHAHP